MVRVSLALQKHIYSRQAVGWKLGRLSQLAGFPDYSGFSHQLKKPFAPTELNCTRWRTVAQLVKFDGEPLQETES